MILPKVRDPRLTTLRRGGTLTDDDHHSLALWAAECTEHVLPYFTEASTDPRPVQAVALTRAWVRGEITMTEARTAAFHANAAARDVRGPARDAAHAAGQAVAVAHVAAHYLGAAAYALRAVRAAAEPTARERAVQAEWEWQFERLPPHLRTLVLDDQGNRNSICWGVFRNPR